MSFKGPDRVSLLTLGGRVLVTCVMGKYQRERFINAKGQADLVLRKKGKWFLLVTVDVPAAAPVPTNDFIGVDLGIANIATDSDGTKHSGKPVDDIRRKHNLQRKRLQRKCTKGAKKKLKRVAKKEARFRQHENHRISKEIVETAKGTGRGIALEDLKGIRERVTARGGDARNRLSGWSFHQFYCFLSYKARLSECPWSRSTRPTLPRPVPNVGIANAPTEGANLSSVARRAATSNTPMLSGPGTSETPLCRKAGLWPQVSRP